MTPPHQGLHAFVVPAAVARSRLTSAIAAHVPYNHRIISVSTMLGKDEHNQPGVVVTLITEEVA